ncbi:putative phospholipid ABC transporter-binding protein MlaD [bacterium BMS3Bbin11]|nr:putative phospholipid ABC transporter-binding protein MlaD [bacterium BMS3Abin11]GBE45559.1 putative phospholipid ABC transporter-binding protein MlaD [bacterium BMS3Bbin11]GMT41087.1 MAG: outer membrane lipid asymmetry maintenance protein MlaD [bacterium]HDH14938.1 outer membrane lipid asymmetry maintenance protein MlaD [Gammaproteobacteria bacterium]HDZ79420.1 outer membrane lipid asymmetry maintenance protein MlaD [Gammaproteobacteria bacterium]
MKRQLIEITVGLFVIAGLVALLFLSFRVSNLNSDSVSNPYQVKAQFDNIGGLKVRAPVTMAGVRIGRVSKISLNSASYQAQVTMDISGAYNKLPIDSSASINTQGLLGEQFVSLDPGGEKKYLKDGDSIKLTQSAVMLENLIGQLLFKGNSKNP